MAGCRGKTATGEIPAEDSSRKNPVESNAASIAEGQRLYHATDCAMCHGKSGEGKGVLAKDINMNLRNWQDSAALTRLSDGDLFYIIMKGKGRMPAYESREPGDQAWHMVNYIRSFAAGAIPRP